MPKIEGLQKVLEAFRKRAAEARQDEKASVVVGYTQAYAIFVHENLEAKHAPGKKAKFLEEPFRQLRSILGDIVKTALRQGKTMSMSLLLAGLRLQRESQKIVPIDTGALKNSAFTRLEK